MHVYSAVQIRTGVHGSDILLTTDSYTRIAMEMQSPTFRLAVNMKTMFLQAEHLEGAAG